MNKRQYSSADNNQMSRYAFDQDNESFRVTVVAGDMPQFNVSAQAQAATKPEQVIKYEQIQVPTIIKEQEIKIVEIEKQVIVKEIQIVEVPKIIEKIVIERIEIPVIIKETETRTVSLPAAKAEVITEVRHDILEIIPLWFKLAMLTSVIGNVVCLYFLCK